MFQIAKNQFKTIQQRAEIPAAPPESDGHAFDSAQHAVAFATEILRIRQFPKIPSCYQSGARPSVVSSGGEPTGDTAYATALSVYQCVYRLPDDLREIIQLHMWGDYVTPARFRAAAAMQEKWRREGKRVRLCHRYSQRQLATLLGIGKSTAGRRLEKAFLALEDDLQRCGLVEVNA